MILLSSFIFGLVFGSFLNVVIYRLKNGRSVIFDRSFCPNCKKTLKWYDLVPMLSFIYLHGRCRYCSKKISWQYPLVEVLSGLIWILVLNKNLDNFQFSIFNFGFWVIFYEIFIFSALLVIAVYDFKYWIIPNKIIYPLIAITFIYNLFLSYSYGEIQNHLIKSILAAAAIFIFLFLFFYFSEGKAMGLGDAKLGFFMGLFLGPLLGFIALLVAFILGAAYGIILLLAGKKSLKSKIAFGQFLALGVAIAFFGSEFLLKFINF